jgi:hypothetical protein
MEFEALFVEGISALSCSESDQSIPNFMAVSLITVFLIIFPFNPVFLEALTFKFCD